VRTVFSGWDAKPAPAGRAGPAPCAGRAADGAEVTAEANPEDVTVQWLQACRQAGINRISLGVQSLDEAVLEGLGRSHDAKAVVAAACRIADAGIARYSVDLIFGGAGESDASWRRTLTGVPLPRSAAPPRQRLRPHRRTRNSAVARARPPS